MAGKFTYQVGFKLTGDDLASQVKAPLQAIQSDIQKTLSTAKAGLTGTFAEGIKQARILEDTLKRATTDKGLSFMAMQQGLQRANSSVEQMVAGLSGANMTNALNTFVSSIAQADRKLISVTAQVKEMQRILAQSVRYSLAQSIQTFVIGQIQSAVYYVQGLNRELTQIAIVAPEVAGEIDRIGKAAIETSRAMRVTARDYLEAAVIFWQQGLTEDEVNRRTQITIKAAKASGQTMKIMSEQLTAVWNTYQMAGDEMIRAASVAARLGADTAAEFADIAVGMQIAAAGASMLGVEFDSLAAIMATVRETTLMSASVIGNAFKTIFARLSNLRAGGIEDGVDLGQITNQLNELGVHVLDASGNLRDLDDVIWQLGTTWDQYSRNQQIAIAQVIGGVRQYQHFLALMQNFDQYQRNLLAAQGTVDGSELERQYHQFLLGIDSAKENMTEAWQRAFAQLFAQDDQLTFFRGMESIGKTVENIISNFGELRGLLIFLGGYLATKIGPSLGSIGTGIKVFFQNLSPAGQLNAITREFEKMERTARQMHDRKQDAITTAAGEGRLGQLAIQEGRDPETTTSRQLKDLEDERFKVTQAKLKIGKDLAIQNITLNKLIKDGSAAQKIQAEAVKEQNRALADQVMLGIDNAVLHKEKLERLQKEIAFQMELAEKQESQDPEVLEKIELMEKHQQALERQKQVQKEIGEQEQRLATGSKRTKEKAKQALKTLKKESGQLETEIASIAVRLEQLEDVDISITLDARRAKTNLTAMDKAIKGLTPISDALMEGQDVTQLLETVQKNIKNIQEELKNIDGLDVDSAEFKEFADTLTLIGEGKDLSGLATLEQKMMNILKTSGMSKPQLEEYQGVIKELGLNAENTAMQKALLDQQIAAGLEGTDLAKYSLQQFGNGITKVAGGCLMLGNAINSMFRAIDDGNISWQTILMLTLQYGAAVTALTKGITVLMPAQAALKSTTLATALATIKGTKAQKAAIAADIARTFAIGKKNIAMTISLVLAKKLGIVLAPLTIIVMALVAAIAAIVAIFMVFSRRAEEARKQTLAYAEASAQAAQENARLRDSLQGLSRGLVETRRQLREGTLSFEEYRNAVEDVRKQVAQLNSEFQGLNLILSPTMTLEEMHEAIDAGIMQANQMVINEANNAAAHLGDLRGMRDGMFAVGGGGQGTMHFAQGRNNTATGRIDTAMESVLGAADQRYRGWRGAGDMWGISDIAQNYDDIMDALRAQGLTAQQVAEVSQEIRDQGVTEAMIEAFRMQDHAENFVQFEEMLKTSSDSIFNSMITTADGIQSLGATSVEEIMRMQTAQDEYQAKVEQFREDERRWQDEVNRLRGQGESERNIERQTAEYAARMNDSRDQMNQAREAGTEYARFMDHLANSHHEFADEAMLAVHTLNILQQRFHNFEALDYSQMEYELAKAMDLVSQGLGDLVGATIPEVINSQVRQNIAQGMRALVEEFDETGDRIARAAWVDEFQERLEMLTKRDGDSAVFDDLLDGFENLGPAAAAATVRMLDFHAAQLEIDSMADHLATFAEQEAEILDRIYNQRAEAGERLAAQAERMGFFGTFRGLSQTDFADFAASHLPDDAAIEQFAANAAVAGQTIQEYLRDNYGMNRRQSNLMAEYIETSLLNIDEAKQTLDALHAEKEELAEHLENQVANQAHLSSQAIRELRDEIRALSLEGDIHEQLDNFAAMNILIEEYNKHLQILLGETAPQMVQLTDYIFLMNEEQREATMIAHDLQFVTLELAYAQERLNNAIADGAPTREAYLAHQIAMQNVMSESARVIDVLEEAQGALARQLAQNTGLNVDAINMYATHLQRLTQMTNAYDGLSSNLATNREAAVQLAAAMMRMDRGAASVESNFESWRSTLNATRQDTDRLSIASFEAAQALSEMDAAISDMLNIEAGSLSLEFLLSDATMAKLEIIGTTESLDQMRETIGDLRREGAADLFGTMAQEATELAMQLIKQNHVFEDLYDGMYKVKSAADVMGAAFEEIGEYFALSGDRLGHFNDLMYELSTMTPGEELSEEFIAGLNYMMQGMDVTAESFRNMTKAMGITVSYESEFKPVEQEFPTTITSTEELPGRSVRVPIPGDPGNYSTQYWPSFKTVTKPGPPVRAVGYKEMISFASNAADGSTDNTPVILGKRGNRAAGSGSLSGGGGATGGAFTGGTPALASRPPRMQAADSGGSAPRESRIQEHLEAREIHERFANLGIALQRLTRELQRINDAMDGAFGIHRLRMFDELQRRLVQQSAAYRAIIYEAQRYIAWDRKRLQDPDSGLGNIFSFDEHGSIANLEQVQRAMEALSQSVTANSNSMIDAWNALANADEQELMANILEAAKDYHGDKEEFIDKMLEIIALHQDAVQRYQDARDALVRDARQYLQNEIDRIQLSIELRVEINQRDVRLINQQIARIGQNMGDTIARGMEQNIGSLIGIFNDKVESFEELGDMVNWLNDVNGGDPAMIAQNRANFIKMFGQEALDHFDEFGVHTSMVEEALVAMGDAILDAADAIHAEIDRMFENYLATIQRFQREFDALMRRVDATDRMVAAYERIWELSFARVRTMEMELDFAQQHTRQVRLRLGVEKGLLEHREEEVERLRTLMESYQESMQGMVNDGEGGWELIDDRLVDETRLLLKEAEAAVLESQAAIREGYGDLLEAIRRETQAKVDRIVREWENSFRYGWSRMQDMFNQHQRFDSFYVHEQQVAFELRELLRNIDQEFSAESESDFILGKRADWLERVNRLKAEGTNLTQHQLDILKAQFDLDVKKAAWEEKQESNRASTMRLARDASGNWSYIFSDDGDAGAFQDELRRLESDIDRAATNVTMLHVRALEDMQSRFIQAVHDYQQHLLMLQDPFFAELYEYDEAFREWFHATADLLREQKHRYADYIDYFLEGANQAVINHRDIAAEYFPIVNGIITDWREAAGIEFRYFYTEAGDRVRQLHPVFHAEVDKWCYEIGRWVTANRNAQIELNPIIQLIKADYDSVGAAARSLSVTIGEVKEEVMEYWRNMRTDIGVELRGINLDVNNFERDLRTALGNVQDENDATADSFRDLQRDARRELDAIVQRIVRVNRDMVRAWNDHNNALRRHITQLNATRRAYLDLYRAMRRVRRTEPGNLPGEMPVPDIPDLGGHPPYTGENQTEELPTVPDTPVTTPQKPVVVPDPPRPTGPIPGAPNQNMEHMNRYIVRSFQAYPGVDVYPTTPAQLETALRGATGLMNIKGTVGSGVNANGWALNPRFIGVTNRPAWHHPWSFNTNHPDDLRYLLAGLHDGRTRGVQNDSSYTFARFRTGGLADFTGPAWLDGTSSRPELVLNPQDTQNMLAAVHIMRESINRHLDGLGARYGSRLGDKSIPLDQQVHITADFPNVRDSSEIQDAFNNLINQAAQYRVAPRQ